MMPAVWCAAYVVVLASVGCAALFGIVGAARRSVLEFAAMALLLGMGITGTLLTWLSMSGLPPSRALLLLLGAVGVGCALLFYLKDRCPHPIFPVFERAAGRNAATAALVLGLAAANGVAAVVALGFNLFEWDAMYNWGIKAKVLFLSPLSPRPFFFTDPALAHWDYPLLFPMLTAGAYAMMNQLHEPLGKIILPLLYLAQTILAYTGARTWLDRNGALLVALLLIGAPFSIEHAGIGNADTVLATFYLASVVCLLRWLKERSPGDLVLAALFGVFLATTKSEGLPIAVINAAVIFAIVARSKRRQDWIAFGWFMLIFIAGVSVWWVWRMKIVHSKHDDYLAQLKWSVLIENLDRIGPIFRALAATFVEISTWGAFWIIAFVMAILGFRAFKRQTARVLWTLFALQLALYVLAYIISDWEVNELLRVTRGRLLLHAAPAAMLLISVHWSEVQHPAGSSE